MNEDGAGALRALAGGASRLAFAAALPTILGQTLLPSLLRPAVASAQEAPRAQVRRYPLATAAGLRLVNLTATPVTYAGKRGLRLTATEAASRGVARLPIEQQGRQVETLAVVDGVDFTDGVIEAEIAGAVAPGAAEGARGFVGIAFRVRPDLATYDQFYLRPTNGRSDDQERRNHAAQYVSHPDWPWDRLRRETPSKYEAYVDLVPGAWTKVRIDVRGDTARFYVHGRTQPTLVVNDVKTGARGRGAIAVMSGPGTIAHVRDLRVGPYPRARSATHPTLRGARSPITAYDRP